MASIGKRSGGYRVKYRDPLGRQKSKSLVARDDLRRFSREVEVDKTRGAWLDRPTPTSRSPSGPRPFSACTAACRRARKRPIAATSRRTSFPASAPTGSGGCRPKKSRSGCSTRSTAV